MNWPDRWKISILIGAAVICFLSDSLTRHWILYARLNLFLNGCLFCHVESPHDISKLANQSESVSKLVYKNGAYVGYLNRYGMFVSVPEQNAGDGMPEAFRENVRILVTLFYLKALSGGIFVVGLVYLAWRIASRRKDGAVNLGLH